MLLLFAGTRIPRMSECLGCLVWEYFIKNFAMNKSAQGSHEGTIYTHAALERVRLYGGNIGICCKCTYFDASASIRMT